MGKRMLNRLSMGLLLVISMSACAEVAKTFQQTLRSQALQTIIQKNHTQLPSDIHQIMGQINTNASSVQTNGHYYQHPNDNVLAHGAKQALQSNDTAKTVVSAFNKRPVFRINRKGATFSRSNHIVQDANHIMRGQSDQFVDCHHEKICQMQYQQKHCSEATRSFIQTCQKTMTVTITKQKQPFSPCGHLVVLNANVKAPQQSRYIGPWYPCHFDFKSRQTICRHIYWVKGANQGKCILSAVSVFGKANRGQGQTMQVPTGFPLTLTIQDQGGYCGRYSTDKNHAVASFNGQSIGLAPWQLSASKALGKTSQSENVTVKVRTWNTDHNSCPQIGLATLSTTSSIKQKKAVISAKEHCDG